MSEGNKKKNGKKKSCSADLLLVNQSKKKMFKEFHFLCCKYNLEEPFLVRKTNNIAVLSKKVSGQVKMEVPNHSEGALAQKSQPFLKASEG